jgi:cell division protein FtsQ
MPRSIDKKKRIIFYILLFILLSTINQKSEILKKNTLLKIKHITVYGLEHEKNIEIYNELKIILSKNILLVDKDIFKKVFIKNNLVESFIVKKKYPDSISIDIKEADLLAIISLNYNLFFIGSNGKLIEYDESIALKKKLPFVFGKPNNLDFIKFKKNIDKSIFNYNNIESIYYFINKRWDVKTKQGILIRLPKNNITKKLNLANNIMNSKKFTKNKIIDLRILKRIIVSDG